MSRGGKTSPKSTERVSRHRERRRRGVVFVASVEIYPTDYSALKRAGYLESDDPAVVTQEQFQVALCRLLDAEAQRLGLIGPAKQAPAA